MLAVRGGVTPRSSARHTPLRPYLVEIGIEADDGVSILTAAELVCVMDSRIVAPTRSLTFRAGRSVHPWKEDDMMRGSFRLAVAASLLFAVCLVPCGLHAQNMFRRGDVDDSGGINLTDPVHLLQALFGESGIRIRCRDAADADDNGESELTDAVYLLNFLFRRGAPPPAPFPDCGVDPTRDTASCIRRGRCQAEAHEPSVPWS